MITSCKKINTIEIFFNGTALPAFKKKIEGIAFSPIPSIVPQVML
jgi:hypothetical protein